MKVQRWIILLVMVVGVIVLYNYSPIGTNRYPPCIFKKITGFNCPGCGNTRAVYSILHGKFRAAADYNLLLFILLPFIIAGLVQYATGKPNRLWKLGNRPLWMLALIICFTVLRNLDFEVFSWLNADK